VGKMDFKITTLIENNPGINSNLYNEHGLSLYLQIGEMNILFDTGKSGDFIKNADKLDVDLNNLKYVVLSHGHYDHSGGFTKLVEKIKTPYKLIIGKGFFNNKYRLTEEGTYKYNGNSFDEEFVRKNNIEIKYIQQDSFYITEDIIIFSNFKRNNNYEKMNKNFQIKEDGKYALDNFEDEIIVSVKSSKGLILIVGCSHIGIVNIIQTIKERINMDIYGIVGGTHLIEADELRLNSTIDFLKENNVQILGLSHCTGEKALEKIKLEFKDQFVYNNTGNIINIK
jgi:7,8-dihydropterin-6-yl-methyl-4-(beta-D-ribofuranosyl)aminobenzene 5'-phosphate synthase